MKKNKTKYIQKIRFEMNKICKNREEIRLVWLDENLDNSLDCQLTESMLIELNPSVQFYTNIDRCLDLIKSVENEQIFLIVSGSLIRKILLYEKNYSSLVVIFIFCVNREYHQDLLNENEKIIGIYTRQDELLRSISIKLSLYEKQVLAFNLFDQKEKSIKNLSKDAASFLWHQMLIYILKQIPQTNQSKEEMINLCSEYYQNNPNELSKIIKFEKEYQSNLAIQWYTDECFLYKLLNKALRTEDVQLLYIFRFFLIDLCSIIEKRKLRGRGTLKVYRGTKISKDEFKKLNENLGEIISTNGFLSTSKNKEISIEFAQRSSKRKDFESILFEIHIDFSLQSIECVDIQNESLFQNEEEILFNLNSTFQINSISFDSKLNLWIIQLNTTDKGSDKFQDYLSLIKEDLDNCSPIIYFGSLLWKELGQTHQAKKYFEMLLKSLPENHQDLHSVYNSLANLFRETGEFKLALQNYQISLKIRQKLFPKTHLHIASSYGNIGLIYQLKRNYPRALKYFQKTFEIEEINHSDNHLRKAKILDYIGAVYTEQNQYEIALDYHTRALNMFQLVLPKDHVDTARCLGNIGILYDKQKNYLLARDYYQKQFDMLEQCLPFDHPNLSITFRLIISIYIKINQIDKGLEYCQEKLQEQMNRLGHEHISIGRTLNIMGDTLSSIDLNKSLEYYQQGLTIFLSSTPPEYQEAIMCLKNMGATNGENGKTEEAIECYFKALDLSRQSLSSEHIDLAEILGSIAYGYELMDNTTEAIRYYKQSLSIFRANYGLKHEEVKETEEKIERLNQSLESVIF